jgi:hypothetical protein
LKGEIENKNQFNKKTKKNNKKNEEKKIIYSKFGWNDEIEMPPTKRANYNFMGTRDKRRRKRPTDDKSDHHHH